MQLLAVEECWGQGTQKHLCVQVCDDRADRGGAELAQLLHLIPPDKLMIETDGPYLVPRTIKPSKARPRRYTTSVPPAAL